MACYLSLVMGPHSKNFHDPVFLKHLIDKPVLNVDSSGIGTGEIANQLFIKGRSLEWVLPSQVQQCLSLGLEIALGELFRIFYSLLGIGKLPRHQSSSDSKSSTGVAIPSADGLTHARNGQQIHGFLNRGPILFRNQNSTISLARDFNWHV